MVWRTTASGGGFSGENAQPAGGEGSALRSVGVAADVAAPISGWGSASGGTALSTLSRLLGDAASSLDDDVEAARQILFRAVALLDGEDGTARSASAGLAPWQIKKTLAHIELALDTTIRIEDLARLARLSASYFSRAFKVSMGVSPQKFIVDRRTSRVQTLMLTTEMSLCEIAGTCGFSDQAHMSRVFRRITGTTPNAWRRALGALPYRGGGRIGTDQRGGAIGVRSQDFAGAHALR